MSKRHYPPAYYKYRKSHTFVSICIPKDIRFDLDIMRGEKSWAAFVRNLFLKYDNEVKKGVEKRLEMARQEVRDKEDNFKTPCSICGKPMHFSSRDKNWPEVMKSLNEVFKDWRHTPCQEKEEEEKKKQAEKVSEKENKEEVE